MNGLTAQLGPLLTCSLTSTQAITYKEDLNALQVVEGDQKSKVDAKAVEVLNGIFKYQSFKQLKLHQQVILCDNLRKVETQFAFDPCRTMEALFDEDWDLDSLKEIHTFSKNHKMGLFVENWRPAATGIGIMTVYARTINNAMNQQLRNYSQFETRTICYCLLADLRSHFGFDEYPGGLFYQKLQLQLGKDISCDLMQHVNENRALLEERIANLVYPDLSKLSELGRVQAKIRYDLAESGINCLDRMLPIVTLSHGFRIVRQFIYTRSIVEAEQHQLTLERSLQMIADQIEQTSFELQSAAFQSLKAISESAVPSEISERVPFLTNFIPDSLITIIENYLGLDCVFQALLQVSLSPSNSMRNPDSSNCDMLGKLLQNSNISQASKLRVLQFFDMVEHEKPLADIWAQKTIDDMSRRGLLKAVAMKEPAWHFATEMLKYFEANPSPTRKIDSLVKLLRG